MAVGLKITLDRSDIRKIERGVNRLMDRRAMDSYGRIVRQNTRDRMKRETDVEGRPFHPLSQSYAATKRGPGILRETRDLFRSIFVEAQAAEARVGTSIPYGTWHQTGLPEDDPGHARLPQREWLGLTDLDLERIGHRADDIWEGYFERIGID